MYKIFGIGQNDSQENHDQSSGESFGPKNLQLDIVRLKPNYDYEIMLFAKTKAGKGRLPAAVNASTITIDTARPPAPININITQIPGVTTITWQTERDVRFLPDNYTLLVKSNKEAGFKEGREFCTESGP